MDKVNVFFASLLITLLSLILASCSTKPQAATTSVVKELSMPALVVAEYAPPPGHIAIESYKVLQYQSRHKYTVKCLGVLYGAHDYQMGLFGTHVELLSGQHTLVSETCQIRKAEPHKAIYVYIRDPPEPDGHFN